MFKLHYINMTKVEVRSIANNRCVQTFDGPNAKVEAKKFIQDQNWSDTRSLAA